MQNLKSWLRVRHLSFHSDTKNFKICTAIFLKKRHMSILAFHLYIIYERPKWTCHTFLEKWLNRFGNFWYQIESMNVLRVNYGLDFAFSPRGPCPRPFLSQKFVAWRWCHLAVKKGNWMYALSSIVSAAQPLNSDDIVIATQGFQLWRFYAKEVVLKGSVAMTIFKGCP